jgi:hypothetical protein
VQEPLGMQADVRMVQPNGGCVGWMGLMKHTCDESGNGQSATNLASLAHEQIGWLTYLVHLG